METQLNLKDLQGGIRRRYKLCLSIFVFVFLIAVLVAILLPPIFKSSAMIMIEEQQIPTEYVKSTITSYAEERLQMITRQIMKYSQLKNIIQQFDLYPEMVANDDMAGAVNELKESILLETINFSEGNKSATVAFNLSYEGAEPKVVMKVTEALSRLYLQEEYKAREKLASVTTDFFKQELATLKEQVKFHEDRMREFKSKHIGALPENTAFNMQNVSRLEMELERINSTIRSLEDRKIYLKGQLANVEPLKPVTTSQGKLASNPKQRLKGLRLELIQQQARLSEKHPDIRKLKAEIAKLEAQVGTSDEAVDKIKLLSDKRTKLAELKGRLSAKHPDVIRLTKEVNILSRQVDKLLTEKSIVEISEDRPDNPAYINLLTQVASADAQINSLRGKENKIQSNLLDLRAKLSNAPLIEQEYNEISLDLNNAKHKYKEILNNLTTAQVAQQMERQQKGEKFTILEPAYLPSAPYKPNRLAIVLLGFLVAVGISVTIAAVQEAMDHTLKNEEELARESNLPVFSSISLVQTDEEHRRKRIRYVLCTAGVISACLIILAIANRIASY
jgi:uncharacterized protein involved in exopolysaccharide biosynthesis